MHHKAKKQHSARQRRTNRNNITHDGKATDISYFSQCRRSFVCLFVDEVSRVGCLQMSADVATFVAALCVVFGRRVEVRTVVKPPQRESIGLNRRLKVLTPDF